MTAAHRWTYLLLAAVVAATACSGRAPGGGATDGQDGAPASASGQVISAAASDLTGFWSAELPRRGGPRFVPAPGPPVQLGEGSSVRCGDQTVRWSEIRGNALYCPQTDRIAIDGQGLASDLLRRFSPLGLAAVVAHEYGHAVQRRLEHLDVPPIVRELQADCLAGAWLGSLRSEPTPSFAPDDDQLALPLVAVTTLRDRLGTDPAAGEAHGSGFDRLVALLDGIDRGAARCLEYEQRPPALTAQPFLSDTDRANAGEQPFHVTLASAAADLNDHYNGVAAAAGEQWVPLRLELGSTAGCAQGQQPSADQPLVTCGDTSVAVAVQFLGGVAGLGDMALAAELGRQWALEATRLAPRTLPPTQATVECLTGYWVGTLHPNAPNRAATRQLRLSPGDLDEVAVAILTAALPAPLDRLRAFHRGFTDGLAACRVPN